MKNKDMTQSLWMKLYRDDIQYPSCYQSKTCDVVIIGGGMTGLSAAYHLSLLNYKIIIIEADKIASSTSGRNTGKLTAQHGLIYHHLSLDKAKHYYQCQKDAIDDIERICKQYTIECSLQRTTTMIQAKEEDIEKEYQRYQELNIPGAIYLHQFSLAMHHQAKMNPYAFLRQLAKILCQKGVEIYENSIFYKYQKHQDQYIVEVNETFITAKTIIFATQFPIVDQGHFYYTRMFPIQKTIHYAKCYDHYLPFLRLSNQGYSLNTHQDYLLYVEQEGFFENDFFSKYQFQHLWTNSDYISADHLPYIGYLDKKDPDVLFAGGYSQWGNSNGFMAGKILSRYVENHILKEDVMFSPQRIVDRFHFQYIQENMKTLKAFIKSHMQQVDKELPDVGEGKLIHIVHHTFGVYREKTETYHVVDVTCPHKGCLCQFHAKDLTWDCPCHGSRFDYYGHIVKGPSRYQLPYLLIEDEKE